MVQVREDELPAMTAESTSSPANLRHAPPRNKYHSNNHHHHHHHHHNNNHSHSQIHQSFPHFHHWTYPNSAPSAAATFHFGPGFEPQKQHQCAASLGSCGDVATNAGLSTASASSASHVTAPPHVVHFIVNPGVTVSFQMGDSVQVIKGPVTVPMVSTNSSPPIAMPVQVPPGHVVQQIVDESGMLRHVILSPQPQLPMQQHYGHGNGPNQPPQPYYNPQGLPPGYVPPHFAHVSPLHMGHVPPPNHQGHSPPPPHNFHKDERTHRQYVKLKNKLEQKKLRGEGLSLNSPQGTPPISPRKELVNGLRRNKERGMSSVGTSEDGEEGNSVQDEDDDVHLLTEMLSTIGSPQVTELSSRCALLHWSPPDRLTEADGTKTPELEVAESDLRYEVLLSDKGKEGKYKAIYNGISLSCRIQDLKPGTEYSACVQVHLEEIQGSPSDPSTFTTPACEPDQPLPPKLATRTRTNLQLRWNAPLDNGSQISQYVLECDDGKGYAEIYKSRGKQHNVTKLQQETSYKFRLAAVNECGKSAYSEEVVYATSGCPPSQPDAPVLKAASTHGLHLAWQARPADRDFLLQMDDRETGHGFLPVYNGKDTSFLCDRLRRHADFKFRLRAANEEGSSRWSDEVVYRTLPERPGQQARPVLKGRVHAQSFKVKWDPPSDRGGANITKYFLELDSGKGFESVYAGGETEHACDRLRPGTSYQVRVSCASAGGTSDWSEPATVTTDPVCPGPCEPPRLHGKPRANSLTLKWAPPAYDGGSAVTEFELSLTLPDQTQRQAYKGAACEALVSDLEPGQAYAFQLRAANKVGSGAWSEPLQTTSGAAAPCPPLAPHAQCRTAHHVLLSWAEPVTNGAPVTEYRLEASAAAADAGFATLFQGLGTTFDAKALAPASTYYYRLQACNSAGWSGFSAATEITTPASAPAAMLAPRYVATPTTMTLTWLEPANHGSPILHYNVDVGDRGLLKAQGLTLELEDMTPETTYRVRVQAVNEVGAGAFSPALKAATPPPPPAPPRLECVRAGHGSIKLKWGDGRNTSFTRYCVTMENQTTLQYQVVYQGTSQTCKISRLHEQTSYHFRIMAANDAGEGEYSDVHEYTTCIAPPPSLKAPRVSEVTRKGCVVEWAASKPMGGDGVAYQLQLSRVRDQEYKQVYRGTETRTVVRDLEAGAEYSVRVCPVRVTAGADLPGAFSPPTSFATPTPDLPAATTAKHSAQVTDKKPMADQHFALLLIAAFVVFGVIVAAVVNAIAM